jgi:hypothetical protein
MTKINRIALPALGATLGWIFVLGMGSTQANAQGGDRFEISALKAVRPSLARTVAALQSGDIAAAKSALEDYDTGRRGIEVYLNARDKNLYRDLESDLRVKIGTGLKSPKPDLAVLTADARKMLAKYDEFIAVAAKAPPLNPLYDDVARLRIFRAILREVDIAIRAHDFAKARVELMAFSEKLDSVKGILKVRSPEALDAVTNGIAQLRTELKSPKPDAPKMMGYIRGITSKYNVVLAQVTGEARIQQSTK